ncbi:hypothetical protein [Vibrio phage BONAISHI]|nr:hypothetical protein [Vibrio phage BONAISHI]
MIGTLIIAGCLLVCAFIVFQGIKSNRPELTEDELAQKRWQKMVEESDAELEEVMDKLDRVIHHRTEEEGYSDGDFDKQELMGQYLVDHPDSAKEEPGDKSLQIEVSDIEVVFHTFSNQYESVTVKGAFNEPIEGAELIENVFPDLHKHIVNGMRINKLAPGEDPNAYFAGPGARGKTVYRYTVIKKENPRLIKRDDYYYGLQSFSTKPVSKDSPLMSAEIVIELTPYN